MQLMLQATVCDCLALDPFAFEEDGLGSSEQDAVLERLMPALDLALGLRVIRGAADVLYFLPVQPRREILCDV